MSHKQKKSDVEEKSKSKGKQQVKQKIAVNKGSQIRQPKANSAAKIDKPAKNKNPIKKQNPKIQNKAPAHPSIKQKPIETKLQDELLDGIKQIISKPVHRPTSKSNVMMRDPKVDNY